MSHKPNVYSQPGTPLVQRTVGELVAERPGRSRVFQSFGIDFCCQGSRTLTDACAGKNVPLASVVEQLEAELADKTAPIQNPAELPPAELADYIVKIHHGFLRRELPRLNAMSVRVAHVHGGHTPSLVEMCNVYLGMEKELFSHLVKEEEVLFPAVIAMSKGEAAPGPLESPMICMMHEHEEVGAALARLRELSNGFQPPPDACNTYRALFAGLQDLEEDTHRHIHLENAVLFPAAKAMEEKVANL
ncbi:MAG: iron-sulfur cluster repair di-iron protein [Verrucomicrobia bacterium]|nr:iron-sulfur cluster repair di-iron protein [Verrucomicrobiota bacterium]